MAKTLVLLLLLTSVALQATDRVRITIRPAVLMAGQTLQIRCRVEPHEQNRWLEYGVEDYTSSGRQLDGADAPITTTTFFDRIPCGVGVAFCNVTAQGGQVFRSVAHFTVGGC